jgi:hypothetical protein
MADEKLTNTELSNVIQELLIRVVKVAELVDHVFPEQAVGQGIKETAATLKKYVQELVDKNSSTEIIDIDEYLKNHKEGKEVMLSNLVLTEIIETLQQVKNNRNTLVDSEGFKILSNHLGNLLNFYGRTTCDDRTK